MRHDNQHIQGGEAKTTAFEINATLLIFEVLK